MRRKLSRTPCISEFSAQIPPHYFRGIEIVLIGLRSDFAGFFPFRVSAGKLLQEFNPK